MYEISGIRLMNLANSNARAKVMVRQWYPDLFTEPVVVRENNGQRVDRNGVNMVEGKWYTDNGSYFMMYSQNMGNSIGFFDGNWGRSWSFMHLSTALPATHEQIQGMLRKHCLNEGYTENNFAPISGSSAVDAQHQIDSWYYDEIGDSLYTAPENYGGFCVYKQGRWANITSGTLAGVNTSWASF